MSNSTKAGGADAFNGVTKNSFGQSVESQAQIHDLQTEANPPPSHENLNVYRLVPTAEPYDPRWQNSPCHGEVVVAARTTGDARMIAAARELDFMDVDAGPAEDVTTLDASAFRDDKLYTVIEIEHQKPGLQRGVLSGSIGVDTIAPTQIQ